MLPALFRRTPAILAPAEDFRRAVSVGTCAACAGDVLYSRAARSASCPCGRTRIPRAFFKVAGCVRRG